MFSEEEERLRWSVKFWARRSDPSAKWITGIPFSLTKQLYLWEEYYYSPVFYSPYYYDPWWGYPYGWGPPYGWRFYYHHRH